ncbi:MAG TPA: lycopene beta-cyclase CrtY [Methylibium sp.]|uniref:lycopene beta-cyclase CrtY n=1 Tax=Methylibium sp. TaxID=2067992 RepID=UPI002DB91B3B|nr:lycopene beta-cyclase CrtY [Methylibium sp.]HEU4457855.1 lycopene beta-cyclase CrtY [Methylibium sp.]
MPSIEPARHDLVLAGGGLANGLIAWRLRETRPQLRVLVLESGPSLGGNHTWSFHDGDLDADQRVWMQPFVVHHWPHHAVMFKTRSRRLHGGYNSITSQRFHAVLMARLGDAVRLGTALDEVAPTHVRTGAGERIDAAAVIDGRGFRPSPHLQLRHQKFVGLEVRLAAPHGLAGPTIMDARVPQFDGYRFVYVLPLAADRLLIEDTYYADTAALDAAALRERALGYAEAQGWRVAETLREEHGVLPIAIDGDIDAFWRATNGQPCSGLRAGLFHPTTGYSLPQAIRFADFIARQSALDAASLAQAIERHARATWRSQAFFRMLNRLLFLAGQADTRHQVLAHFYRLPERLVGRFYSERLSIADKLRIVTGRPPVPVSAALKVMLPPRLLERMT